MKQKAPYLPEDKVQCFWVLNALLTKKERSVVMKADPTDLHFTLGSWIRDNWIRKTTVWHLFAEDNLNADALSQLIIQEYQEYLKTGEVHDEPDFFCQIYQEERHYHVIDAHITHGWLYIGESEEVYGSDRDEEMWDILWKSLAHVLHANTEEDLLAILKDKGKMVISDLEKILRANEIPFAHKIH